LIPRNRAALLAKTKHPPIIGSWIFKTAWVVQSPLLILVGGLKTVKPAALQAITAAANPARAMRFNV